MRRPPLILLLLLASCFDPLETPDASFDAGADAAPPPPRVLAWRVVDRDGRPWPSEATPRRPVVELELSRPVDTQGVLFFGPGAQPLEDLGADLEAPPLRAANDRARIEAAVSSEGATVRLLPPELEPGAAYAVAVAGWTTAADDPTVSATPFLAPLRVAAVEAGARATDTWPPDGAAGVPTGLRFAAVRFDDVVSGVDTIGLRDPASYVESTAERVDCGDIGWPPGSCVVLRWEGPLEPYRRYTIDVGEEVTDRGGAPVGPWSATFDTGADAEAPLRLLEVPCALDEVAAPPLCLTIDDGSVSLRGLASSPARVVLDVSTHRATAVAPRGEFDVRVSDLAAATDYPLRLIVEGPSGATFVESLDVSTTPPLATLSIAEVRADARGPEPRQEYVELLNWGAVPVPLEGFRLSDRADREGDMLTAAAELAPGGRALVVAATFDPAHPDDPIVPSGVPLIRVDGTLGSGGLSNAGEPLYLRDPSGRRVSSLPALPAPGPGVCWVRAGTDRYADATDLFAAPCTPGRGTPPP